MLTSQRKSTIQAALRRDGQVIAKQMAEEMAVSEDTIRRDLREMAADSGSGSQHTQPGVRLRGPTGLRKVGAKGGQHRYGLKYDTVGGWTAI